ncbi:hypothetical protein HanPI659440_Chr04g0158371 [Helianthus annuus]|nr:hypothetical protein HanPI659440_Chr04g0158371 [Helianthus annuus]
MGDEIMEFENAKKSFTSERETFNTKKKGLMWRVADAEEKLSQEKELNVNRQKDWMAACETSNRELKAARDEVVKVKAERAMESQEYDRLSAAYKEKESEPLEAQKKNEEARARIAKLEQIVAEQHAQNKTLDLLGQDLGNDYTWLLTRGVRFVHFHIVDRLVRSEELAKYMFDLGGAAYDSGRKDGYAEGMAAAHPKEKDEKFELFKVDFASNYTSKRQEYEFTEFGILKAIDKLARHGVAVETLKKYSKMLMLQLVVLVLATNVEFVSYRLACRELVYRPCISDNLLPIWCL